ncbi:MAG: DUF1501 domain-containing protein [Verrucomicrobiota bacterium]
MRRERALALSRRQPVIGRREMLRRSVYGAAATWTVPGFLGHTVGTLDAFASSAPPEGGSGGAILMIVQLEGGNDGLNMVVPHNVTTVDDPVLGTATVSEIYYAERPTLAIPAESVLPLGSSGFGLHPALTNLYGLWTGSGGNDENRLAIVNGVGYPNANLSHFTSTDYWNTAQPNEPVRDGWVGRYFDHVCSGGGDCDPALGVTLNERPTLAFRTATSNAGITTRDPGNFGWQDEYYGYMVEDPSMERLYRRMTGVNHPYDDGIDPASEALAFVKQSAQSAMISSESIQCALDAGGGTFPLAAEWDSVASNNYLAGQMRDVASLIYGGMDTQVYYVSQGGYDTHADQRDGLGASSGTHANLLGMLDEAIGAFVAEMKAQGNWDRVLVVTVSEFGRKVIENGSFGTDHGAGAPVLAVGGGVNGGLYGTLPSLSAANRIKNDSLDPTVDFRKVYRTVLENWLGISSGQIATILPSAPSDFTPISFVTPFS